MNNRPKREQQWDSREPLDLIGQRMPWDAFLDWLQPNVGSWVIGSETGIIGMALKLAFATAIGSGPALIANRVD